jgi:hypothetical protein
VGLALLGAALLAGAGAPAARPALAQQPEPSAVLVGLTDALSRGDLAASMGFFTEDAAFLGGQNCFPTACLGKAAIQRELAAEVAGHARVAITHVHADGNIVSGRSEVREDIARAAGVERFVEGFVSVVRDGRVASLVTTPDVSDPETVRFLAFLSQLPPPAAPATGPASAGGGWCDLQVNCR